MKFDQSRAWTLLLTLLLAAGAFAREASIRLSCYPGITVADGRSTLTVTAEVRSGGQPVPDGTLVLFETNRGSFRQGAVQTVNGYARSVLIAGSVPGTARVTASARGYNAVQSLEVEFVADRSLLSSAREYIEIVSPNYMVYSSRLRTIQASGASRGVSIRYRDVLIEADSAQITVPTCEVRAKNATLKFGKVTRQYPELYFKLNARRGQGITQVRGIGRRVVSRPPFFGFETYETDRLALVDIKIDGIEASKKPADDRLFAFEDLSNEQVLIAARRAVAYPSREIDFQRADVVVGGSRVMKLPLFQMSANSTEPMVTDQFVNVTGNQLAIDYPYYLSLKPGETSLLRLRSGTRYATGVGAASGTFLDYELSWNRGDEMEGGLTVSGLARSDWGVGIRQTMRLGGRTNVFGQIDFPAHRSLSASGSLNSQIGSYNASLSAGMGRSLSGPRIDNQQYYLSLDSDPRMLGFLPLRFTYGLYTGQTTWRSPSFSQSQTSSGLRSRFDMLPWALGRRTVLNANVGFAELFGGNVAQRATISAGASLSTSIGSQASLNVSYDYLDDGIGSTLLGRNRLSVQSLLDFGSLSMDVQATKSLDIDRLNLYGNLQYRINSLWRFGMAYSIDRYLGDNFVDYSALIGYRIGIKMVGVSFSGRTRRFGIEFLGVPLD